MISEEQALAKILAAIEPIGWERITLTHGRGRFLVEEFFAKLAMPLFNNSSMDGYAVRASECVKGARLRVVGEQPAGVDRELALGNGEAIRIFTGAPIPRGADAVIMQEDVRVDGECMIANCEVEVGENIRQRGVDLAEGQKIASRGERITPRLASLLASQGIAEISAGKNPRVAILSTGDELVPTGKPLAPGQLYESNGVMLEMLTSATGANTANLDIARDEPEPLRAKLAEGLQHDALIVSGGVSVGERDYVKSELKNLGAELDLWRVAIKPGKPFLFGRCGACKIFGLPGNPVSSFVTFFCFVRPALLKMAGARELSSEKLRAITTRDLRNDGDRPHYLRGKFTDAEFTPFGRQESHALFGLSQSNALVRLAPGEEISAGSAVVAFPI